jgi:ABC-type sugar transport system ATPase subunit
MTARLRIESLFKRFPGVQALADVSLVVEPGEIHALLGENGAGKSTLGKIIAGVYLRDSGLIEVDGQEIGTLTEARAAQFGIGIVHQEGSLVRTLSIADNVFAGRQPTRRFGQIDTRTIVARTAALLAQLGVELDPRTKVSELSSAQMQAVEICKVLSQDLKLLILDEPTAALTLTETERLFDILRRLKINGVAIIYVSHRLAEIFTLCDRVTVLKDGQLSGVRDVKDTNPSELIRLMIGREVHFQRDASTRKYGNILLGIDRLVARPYVRNVSFDVREGEIVCLAGLVGSGRSEACEAIFGVRRIEGGTVSVRNKRVNFGGPWDAMIAGIGMVPEDRKDGGLFLSMDIAHNICVTILDRVSERGVISLEKSEALADRFIEELRIATPSARRSVGDLSGGNQQKVMLAKWLAREPAILIVDEPTRGVDVGARSEIYRILRSLAAQGLALIVVSSDLPEVLTLADRIVVFADGRTVGELEGATATEEQVLKLATRFTQVSATEAA